jgi:hypothetical protein
MRTLAYLLLVGACASGLACQSDQPPPSAPAPSMDPIAEKYVKLVLAVGQHDPAYVDAFYGNAEWKAEAEQAKRSLAAIDTEAVALEQELRQGPFAEAAFVPAGDDRARRREVELMQLRREYLTRQLGALRARVGMLQGRTLTFDEESRALYDAVAPSHPESYFQESLAELDHRLPGTGSLIDRYDAFKQQFVIPKDKLSAVFDLAIAECRRRTQAHATLPPGESFTVEFVTNKSWSGYNWYQGNYKSLIQVNTDLPIFIDRAVDLACHEGYPGHHAYNALLEKHLVRDRGWVEMTVYPLFSPQSLIAEGSANYGIEVAFPGTERLAFEKAVLFPAAGLNPQRAEEYYAMFALADKVSYAGNEAARRYLNGEIDRAAATDWLTKYALMARPRAEQRVRFMDDYRSYVINYNLGKDLVRQYVEGLAARAADPPAARWQAFIDLLSSPRLPSGLK